ncbi:MAG TPA: fimbria/pilus periplasmic chaperone [Sphingomicrobium sp.]|nr:fimbria/pilus periplasmic chaperone [Sphingomicrobium sp.]
MNVQRFIGAIACAAAASFMAPIGTARAQLVLSQLVVDLQQGSQTRADIEIRNSGAERAYVTVEPREIVGAGSPAESPRTTPDPEQLGLLVSPKRMILESGQRRIIRVATIGPAANRERVYRVTVKPVVGELSSETSGLKLLVGYDLLVLVRPADLQPRVTGTRSGKLLTLRNMGNVSVELVDGKACDRSGKRCEPLAGGRLYPGAEKVVGPGPAGEASYKMKVRGALIPLRF